MSLWRKTISVIYLGCIVTGAVAQDYPNKVVHIITGNVGGNSDFTARQITQGLTEALGQQVIVDNRGALTGEIVSKALPDGYTVLIDSVSFWLAPLLQTTSYDPVKDFSPITVMSSAPSVLVVNAASPINSIKDLIAAAKAKPGELNFGSAGNGSSSHLAAELLNSMAGVKIVHIPFKGGAPALTAVLGNEVQLTIVSPSAAMPNVKGGKLKILAVTSARPTALVPGVLTVAAAGVPGYEVTTSVAMFAPAKTPNAIINRLYQETNRVLNKPDVKELFFNSGADIVDTTPAQLAAIIKDDIDKWTKVVKEAGIKGN